jgi:hypothetical protein
MLTQEVVASAAEREQLVALLQPAHVALLGLGDAEIAELVQVLSSLDLLVQRYSVYFLYCSGSATRR